MELSNQSVNYVAKSDSISLGTTCNKDNITQNKSLTYDNCYDWYHNTWYPYYQPYYVSYPVYVTDRDKFEKSFKIAKLLLKKKLLVSRKLKDFIALVEEIAKEL